MRRTLLVAEGTLDRPLRNIATTAAGFSITLLVGFGILHLGLPGWVTLAAIIALIVGMAWVKGRYGAPKSFRLEKPSDGGPLRITGHFQDGEIPHDSPAELLEARREGDRLSFRVRTGSSERTAYITPPAFSTSGMDALSALIATMPDQSPDALQATYKGGHEGIKAYDARKLLLLRFTQKPGYLPITWLVAAITLLLWLGVLSLIVGG